MNRKKIKEKVSDMMFDLCKYTLTGSVIVNLLSDGGSYAILLGGIIATAFLICGIFLVEKGG